MGLIANSPITYLSGDSALLHSSPYFYNLHSYATQLLSHVVLEILNWYLYGLHSYC